MAYSFRRLGWKWRLAAGTLCCIASGCVALGCSEEPAGGNGESPSTTNSETSQGTSRGTQDEDKTSGGEGEVSAVTANQSSTDDSSQEAPTSVGSEESSEVSTGATSGEVWSTSSGPAAPTSMADSASSEAETVEPVSGRTEEDMSVEAFCAAQVGLQQPWCDYQDRCCTADDVLSDRFRLPGCQYMDLELADCVEGINQDVGEDGLTFDGHWARACIAALEPFQLQPPAECQGLLLDWAEESNHRAPRMWALDACQRMLTANVADGELCNNVRACAPGLGCGPSSGVDEEFRCHARFGENVPCYSDNECTTDLVCRPLDNGRCLPPSPTGGDCDVPEHCEDGNICHLDYCAPTLQIGDECPNANFCAQSIRCDFLDLTCAPLASAGEGPCDSDFDCAGRCDLDTETCVPICGGTR